RPIAAFHPLADMLRCGSSNQPFVHRAAYSPLKRRSADIPAVRCVSLVSAAAAEAAVRTAESCRSLRNYREMI
ncbi:hypothetical protein, partial [uncultured Sulfitobacter sp.]|uniref:hypothetical protein n=1 Tax=uncultured Sulfitobacter sp. TaxID=191468 RepID=UPI0030DD34B9